MNKSVVIIMSGALAAALLVAVTVSKSLAPKTSGVSSVAMEEILVASKKLSIGSELTQDKVKWQTFPKGAVFRNAIVKSKVEDTENLDIYGKPVLRVIDSGEPISRRALVEQGKKGSNFIAATLAKGMRAFSVGVSAETSVGGFVRPGDYVDVLLTYQVRLRGDAQEASRRTIQRYASQTILKSARVLAVDQDAIDEEKSAKIGRTITLEVSKEGAEALALATTMGDLSFSLRRLGEQDAEMGVSPLSLTTDVSVSDVLKQVNKIQDKASVNTSNIRVYNGSEVKNIPVRTK